MTPSAWDGRRQDSSANSFLSIRGVSVRYRLGWSMPGFDRTVWLQALDGLNLEIARGESVGLVGESGSGKSTLARCITQLESLSEGQILLDGVNLGKLRPEKRRRIQMVFQDPFSSLNPRMTVGQMLREILVVHHITTPKQAHSRSRELLDLVGLPSSALSLYPRQFSGGQRQRIAIARALAPEPELLVADEPIASLDVSVQATILNLLRDLQHRLQLTMLFIAHNLAVVRHVCDRVAVMYLGRIVEVAWTEELFDTPVHPYTQGLMKAIPQIGLRAKDRSAAVMGDPPSPIHLPSGCRFHPRCPRKEAICMVKDPALETDPSSVLAIRENAHAAACHFAWVQGSKLGN